MPPIQPQLGTRKGSLGEDQSDTPFGTRNILYQLVDHLRNTFNKGFLVQSQPRFIKGPTLSDAIGLDDEQGISLGYQVMFSISGAER